MLRDERAWLKANERLALTGISLRNYRHELYFGKGDKNAAKVIRNLLSVGMMVHTMYRLSKNHSAVIWPGVNNAIKHVARTSGNLTYGNDDQVKEAWRHYKSVAHLAAALFTMTVHEGDQRLDGSSLTKWRKSLPRFLGLATAYQAFLLSLGATATKDPQKHSPLLNADQLWLLPPVAVPAVCVDDTPLSDREILPLRPKLRRPRAG
jgi:hypothetical protein